MMQAPAELRERYLEGRLLPFVGAGVSTSVRWPDEGEEMHGPSWKELVDRAAQMLGFKDPNLLRTRGTDLQILEYFRLNNAGEMAMLTNWLVNVLRPPDEALLGSPIHKALSKLRNCRMIYTTNFDDFIERALTLFGRPCKSVVVEAHMGAVGSGGDLCEIVKFHGDLTFPRQMVMSESDYQRRLTLSAPMDYRLRSDLLGRVVLFVGYSFTDVNVSYLFRLVDDQLKRDPTAFPGRRAYITVQDPSDFEIQLFRDRNIEVIPVSGSNLTDDVAELLVDIQREV